MSGLAHYGAAGWRPVGWGGGAVSIVADAKNSLLKTDDVRTEESVLNIQNCFNKTDGPCVWY